MVIITRARQTWDSWAWSGGWQGDFYPFITCNTQEGAEELLDVKFDLDGYAVRKSGQDEQHAFRIYRIQHHEV